MYLQNYIKIHELRYLICCEEYYTIITSAKHCHRESLITPLAAAYSFYFLTNQFKFRISIKSPKFILKQLYHFIHYNLAPINLITLTCMVICSLAHIIHILQFFHFSTHLPLPKVQRRLLPPLYLSADSSQLSQHFLYSPSNSFLQFQLLCCCYVYES